MKKLTAGIFASILGLTAMGAADAAVTSKAYVDGKVEAAVASKAEQSALTQEIADREAADQTLSGQIALKADASALAGKQDLLTGENFKRDASETGAAGNVISSIIVDNGTVTYKTATVETSEDTAELRQRVADVESSQTTQAGQITALQTKDTELAGQIATKAEAQTVTDLATTVSGKADKSALDGYVPTATYNAGQETQDTAITALQAKDTELAGQIATKAEAQTVTDLATTVSGKANATDVYTKEAANAMFVVDADLETYVTKDALTEDQNKQTGDITTAYQAADASLKSELEGKIDTKADSSALADYVQTTVFTQSQTDQTNALEAQINAKADAQTVTDLATEVSGKADKTELKDWVLTETYNAGQATQNTAITALEQFETSVKDAAKTVNNEEGTGEYALTMKLVDDGTGTGAKKPEFVWEQIVRQ